MEQLQNILLKKVAKYRLIHLNQILKFEKDGALYSFLVINLEYFSTLENLDLDDCDELLQYEQSGSEPPHEEPDPEQLYLNIPSFLQKVSVQSKPNQQQNMQRSSRFNIRTKRKSKNNVNPTVHSINSGSSRLSVNQARQSQLARLATHDAKLESIDLEQIFKERGLDIFYMQEQIDEYKTQKQDILNNSQLATHADPLAAPKSFNHREFSHKKQGFQKASQDKELLSSALGSKNHDNSKGANIQLTKSKVAFDADKFTLTSQADSFKEMRSQRVQSAQGHVAGASSVRGDSVIQGPLQVGVQAKQATNDLGGFDYFHLQEQYPKPNVNMHAALKKRISSGSRNEDGLKQMKQANKLQENNSKSSIPPENLKQEQIPPNEAIVVSPSVQENKSYPMQQKRAAFPNYTHTVATPETIQFCPPVNNQTQANSNQKNLNPSLPYSFKSKTSSHIPAKGEQKSVVQDKNQQMHLQKNDSTGKHIKGGSLSQPYQEGMRQKLEGLVKMGEMGKLNEQILKSNAMRSPQKRSLERMSKVEGLNRINSPGRIAVSRLVHDISEKDGDRLTAQLANNLIVDLEESNAAGSANQLRFRDHEREIMQNQKDLIQNLIEHQELMISTQNAFQGGTQFLDTANLDQIEESITSSIEYRGNLLNGGKIFSQDNRKEQFGNQNDQGRGLSGLDSGHELKIRKHRSTKKQNNAMYNNSLKRTYLRKTAPTNIVVSKYNTATGGVSTFRQSNSRAIAKRKDTQRTVELAPGSFGQATGGVGGTLLGANGDTNPVEKHLAAITDGLDQAAGLIVGPATVQLSSQPPLSNNTRPNVVIKDCLREPAAQVGSVESNTVQAIEKSICTPENPSSVQNAGTEVRHLLSFSKHPSKNSDLHQGLGHNSKAPIPGAESKNLQNEFTQSMNEQIEKMRTHQQKRQSMHQVTEMQGQKQNLHYQSTSLNLQQAVIVTDPVGTDPSIKFAQNNPPKISYGIQIVDCKQVKGNNKMQDLLGTRGAKGQLNQQEIRYLQHPILAAHAIDLEKFNQQQCQIKFASSIQNSLTTVNLAQGTGNSAENPINVINNYSNAQSPCDQTTNGYITPNLQVKKINDYMNRSHYITIGAPQSANNFSSGAKSSLSTSPKKVVEQANVSTINCLKQLLATQVNDKTGTVFGLKCPRSSYFKLISKQKSQSISVQRTSPIKQEQKAPVKLSLHKTKIRIQQAKYHRQKQPVRSITPQAFDRTSQKLLTDLFWGLDPRQISTVDAVKKEIRPTDYEKQLLGLKVTGKQSFRKSGSVGATTGSVANTHLNQMLEIYGRVQDLKNKGLISDQTTQFFDIDFLNMLLNFRFQKSRRSKMQKEYNLEWFRYIKRLEKIHQMHTAIAQSAAITGQNAAQKNQYLSTYGDSQVQADLQLGSNEGEIVSKGDDLESLRSMRPQGYHQNDKKIRRPVPNNQDTAHDYQCTSFPIWPEATYQALSTVGPVHPHNSSDPAGDHTSFTSGGEKRETSYRLRPVAEDHISEPEAQLIFTQVNDVSKEKELSPDDETKVASPALNSSKHVISQQENEAQQQKTQNLLNIQQFSKGKKELTSQTVTHMDHGTPTPPSHNVKASEHQLEDFTVSSERPVLPRHLRSNNSVNRTSAVLYQNNDGYLGKTLRQEATPETEALRFSHPKYREADEDDERQLLADDDEEDEEDLLGADGGKRGREQRTQQGESKRRLALFKISGKNSTHHQSTILVDDQIQIINCNQQHSQPTILEYPEPPVGVTQKYYRSSVLRQSSHDHKIVVTTAQGADSTKSRGKYEKLDDIMLMTQYINNNLPGDSDHHPHHNQALQYMHKVEIQSGYANQNNCHGTNTSLVSEQGSQNGRINSNVMENQYCKVPGSRIQSLKLGINNYKQSAGLSAAPPKVDKVSKVQLIVKNNAAQNLRNPDLPAKSGMKPEFSTQNGADSGVKYRKFGAFRSRKSHRVELLKKVQNLK